MDSGNLTITKRPTAQVPHHLMCYLPKGKLGDLELRVASSTRRYRRSAECREVDALQSTDRTTVYRYRGAVITRDPIGNNEMDRPVFRSCRYRWNRSGRRGAQRIPRQQVLMRVALPPEVTIRYITGYPLRHFFQQETQTHVSFERFIENRMRERFPFTGTPIITQRVKARAADG